MLSKPTKILIPKHIEAHEDKIETQNFKGLDFYEKNRKVAWNKALRD